MGNNMVAKLVIFTILLNLAAGLLMVAVVDVKGKPVFDRTATGGVAFDSEIYGESFQTELEESIQPAGSIDDKGDQVYRVLDMMSLGFINRFMDVVDTYMFGIVTIMDNMLGEHLEEKTRIKLFGHGHDSERGFGIFKIIISISYILMGISLFTGKDVVENN